MVKLIVNDSCIKNQDLTEFLNSNNIIELDLHYIRDKLILSDYYYKSLRSLKIYNNDSIIDLQKF
jgi:hypothetical protein